MINNMVTTVFTPQIRLPAIKRIFGESIHAEKTRSANANDYVWKDATAVAGTRFELGAMPFNRAESKDWERVVVAAKEGRFSDIPADILVRCYHSIKSINKDNLRPVATERVVHVYWGRTGTGKSRTAWQEAGLDAYPKDPCTKFWDGYQGQHHVVIDEFRGAIGISHMLRWLDRYPVIIEAKHGATTLAARTLWITSNLDPRGWYTAEGQETVDALMRRLHVVHFDTVE